MFQLNSSYHKARCQQNIRYALLNIPSWNLSLLFKWEYVNCPEIQQLFCKTYRTYLQWMSWDLCQGKFIEICIETPLSFNCSPFSVGFHGMPCNSSTLCCDIQIYTPNKSSNENFENLMVKYTSTICLDQVHKMGQLVLTRDAVAHIT